MSITNATNFRKNVYKYLDSAVEMNDVVYVTTKTGNAVVMSEDDYRSLMETLHLQSIPDMTERLVKGREIPLEECVEVDWRKELKD